MCRDITAGRSDEPFVFRKKIVVKEKFRAPVCSTRVMAVPESKTARLDEPAFPIIRAVPAFTSTESK